MVCTYIVVVVVMTAKGVENDFYQMYNAANCRAIWKKKYEVIMCELHVPTHRNAKHSLMNIA